MWWTWWSALVVEASLTEAASDLRTLLLDQTTSYVGAMSTLEEDKSSAMSGFEYFAPCYTKDDGDAKSGDLLFLALPVAENWRLALRPNATTTYSVMSNPDPEVVDVRHSHETAAGRLVWNDGRPVWRKGMYAKARVTMQGTMHHLGQRISPKLEACFFQYHADAKAWAPNSKLSPHMASWVRFSPKKIHYVGGFGDEHHVGDIGVKDYREAKLGYSHSCR